MLVHHWRGCHGLGCEGDFPQWDGQYTSTSILGLGNRSRLAARITRSRPIIGERYQLFLQCLPVHLQLPHDV